MIIFFHSYVVFFLLKCHAPPSLVSDSKIGKCYSIIIHEIGRKKPILDASLGIYQVKLQEHLFCTVVIRVAIKKLSMS